MARIIGEASIRLTAAGASGLERAIRAEVRTAAQALRGDDFLGPLDRDSAVQESRITGRLGRLFSVAAGGAGAFAQLVTSGMRLALVGTAAGGALAGITSLATGLVGLLGVLGQAAGAAGLLPAIFAAGAAGAATLRLGMVGVGEAMSAVAEGDAQALDEALKNLAPAARQFVLAVRDVKPAFDQLQLDTQQTLFSGLASSIAPLVDRYLPIARTLTQGVAGAFNDAAREAAAFAREGEVVGQVSGIADNIRFAFNQLPGAIQPALSALTDITFVGSGFLPQLAEQVQALSVRFGEFIREAAGSGRLEAFFERAIQAITDIFSVLREVGGIIAGIFRAAETASGGFLGGIKEVLATFHAFIDSAPGQTALINFFRSMQAVADGLAPVFLELVKVIGSSLAPVLADLASTIGPALQPIVAGIGDALDAARPGIQAFAQGFASLLRAVAPLLPIIGQLAGTVGSLLGPVLERLGPIIAQVGETIGTALLELLPQLEPILLQIVDAFGQIMTALLPLVPVFLQVVQAVLPLVPPILQLVSTLLPPLVQLVTALAPIVVAFATALQGLLPIITGLAELILGILLPPVTAIATTVANVAQLVASGFRAMADVISTVFNTIVRVVTTIWRSIVESISGAVNNIISFVRSGFQRAFDAVSSLMGRIRGAVGDAINGVLQFFRDLPGRIAGFVGNVLSAGADIGRNIIQGILNGLSALAGQIGDFLLGIVQNAWNGILSFFGIASPSRLAMWAGEMIGQGLIRGFERIGPAVNRSALGLGVDAMSALNEPLGRTPSIVGMSGLGGAGAGVGRGATVVNQANYMLPGTDVAQFAATVLRRGHLDLSASASSLPTQRQGVQIGVNDQFLGGVRV